MLLSSTLHEATRLQLSMNCSALIGEQCPPYRFRSLSRDGHGNLASVIPPGDQHPNRHTRAHTHTHAHTHNTHTHISNHFNSIRFHPFNHTGTLASNQTVTHAYSHTDADIIGPNIPLYMDLVGTRSRFSSGIVPAGSPKMMNEPA